MSSYNIIPFYVKAIHVTDANIKTKSPHHSFDEFATKDSPFLGLYATNDYTSVSTEDHKGNILHFILPYILTQPYSDTQTYPPIPNRWLIVKKDENSETKKALIISDYVKDEENQLSYKPTIILPYTNEEPFHENDRNNIYNNKGSNQEQPFRYLGRNIALGDPKDIKTPEDNNWNTYFKEPLSALGYGHPQFSNFTPNCHSVLSFYDKDGMLNTDYTVYGWWEDIKSDKWDELQWQRYSDYLSNFQYFDGFELNVQTDWNSTESEVNGILYKVNDGRDITFNHVLKFNSAYFAALQEAKKSYKNLPTKQYDGKKMMEELTSNSEEYTVTIANSVIEALSAFIAQKLSNEKYKGGESDEKNKYKILVEDLLEALQLGFLDDKNQIDMGARFQQARHNRGFIKENAPNLYKVEYNFLAKTNKSELTSEQAYSLLTLDSEINQILADIANLLNQLNNKKKEVDTAINNIYSLKLDLYSLYNKIVIKEANQARPGPFNTYKPTLQGGFGNSGKDLNTILIHQFSKILREEQKAIVRSHRLKQLEQEASLSSEWKQQLTNRYEEIHGYEAQSTFKANIKSKLDRLKEIFGFQEETLKKMKQKPLYELIYGKDGENTLNSEIEDFFDITIKPNKQSLPDKGFENIITIDDIPSPISNFQFNSLNDLIIQAIASFKDGINDTFTHTIQAIRKAYLPVIADQSLKKVLPPLKEGHDELKEVLIQEGKEYLKGNLIQDIFNEIENINTNKTPNISENYRLQEAWKDLYSYYQVLRTNYDGIDFKNDDEANTFWNDMHPLEEHIYNVERRNSDDGKIDITELKSKLTAYQLKETQFNIIWNKLVSILHDYLDTYLEYQEFIDEVVSLLNGIMELINQIKQIQKNEAFNEELELTLTLKDTYELYFAQELRSDKYYIEWFNDYKLPYGNDGYISSLLENEIDLYVKLLQQIKKLNEEIAQNGDIKEQNKLKFQIAQKQGPRYYKPTNPAILIQKEEKETDQSQIVKKYQPQLLYWNIQYRALKTTESQDDGDYKPKIITENFTSSSSYPDFKGNMEAITENITSKDNSTAYEGLVLLADNISENMQGTIKNYLDNNPNIKDEYKKILEAALKSLKTSTFFGQVLNGFDEAFLNFMPTVQLPIFEPKPLMLVNEMRITQYINAFTKGVRNKMPAKFAHFNPIKAGGFKINTLTLFDSFGIKYELHDTTDASKQHVKHFITSEALDYAADTPNDIHGLLKPRFNISAQINARWVQGYTQNKNDIETNDIHHTTPISGWIVPNTLSQTLMIYDVDGTELGALVRKNNKIIYTPGYRKLYTSINEITNDFLRDFVTYVKENDLLEDFLSLITESQHAIDPNNFSQHPEISIFSGHPIALVRLKLHFNHLGELPYSQRDEDAKVIFNKNVTGRRWTDYQKKSIEEKDKVKRFEADKITRAFEKIKIPIKVGDYLQLNDGVVGYWRTQNATISKKSNEDYYADANLGINLEEYFFAPLVKDSTIQHPNKIIIPTSGELSEIEITRTLENQPTYVNLLFDPRAKLNITTGLLPVKTIDIPQKMYYDALRRIEVTFLNAPVITPRGHFRLPIMEDNDFRWEWKYYEHTQYNKQYITKDWFQQACQALNISDEIWGKLKTAEIIKTETTDTDTFYYYQPDDPTNKWDTITSKDSVQFILNHYSGRDLLTLSQDMIIQKSDVEKALKDLILKDEFPLAVWDTLITTKWIEEITEYFVKYNASDNASKIEIDNLTLSAFNDNNVITIVKNNLKTLLSRYQPGLLGTQITFKEFEKDTQFFGSPQLQNNAISVWNDIILSALISSKTEKAKILNSVQQIESAQTALDEYIKDYQKDHGSLPSTSQQDNYANMMDKWIEHQGNIQWIIETYGKGIEPEVQHTDYQLQEIREGWLKILPERGW